MKQLERYISELYYHTEGLEKQKRRSYLQDGICNLAKLYGLTAEKDYKCIYTKEKGKKPVNGRVAVVWKDDKDSIVLACEITSTAYSGHYIKFNTINSKYKLLVYYGSAENKDKFYELDLKYNSDNAVKVMLFNSFESDTVEDSHKNDTSSNSEEYAEFEKVILKLYPGKKSKATRDKQVPKLLKKYGADQLTRCLKRYAAYKKGVQIQYIHNENTFWNRVYIDYLDCNYETK